MKIGPFLAYLFKFYLQVYNSPICIVFILTKTVSIYISIYIYLSTSCLSICLFLYLSIYLSICLFFASVHFQDQFALKYVISAANFFSHSNFTLDFFSFLIYRISILLIKLTPSFRNNQFLIILYQIDPPPPLNFCFIANSNWNFEN